MISAKKARKLAKIDGYHLLRDSAKEIVDYYDYRIKHHIKEGLVDYISQDNELFKMTHGLEVTSPPAVAALDYIRSRGYVVRVVPTTNYWDVYVAWDEEN